MSKPSIVSELEPLFHPQSVAVIGASNDRNKWGKSTFTSLMNHYKGELYAVNNRDEEILGYRAYPKITDIPGSVDLVIIVIPPENVARVMEQCVQKGVKAGVIITAGFAEVGAKGKAMQDEVVEIAQKGGIRLVGPNCMGMWSAPANLAAFMFPMAVLEGPLSLISQGGNIGGALVADATARGVGFQQYVSCGCTADIQIENYIEYLGYDDSVKVLNSGDRAQIKGVVKLIIKALFGSIMPSKALEMEEFLDTISDALTTEKMMGSSFFKILNELFLSVATGDTKRLGSANIVDLMEPIPGALVAGLIKKYGKPVITTTFTEGNTRLSEGGHFPYSNSDRASNVLIKLVEYREYLESLKNDQLSEA